MSKKEIPSFDDLNKCSVSLAVDTAQCERESQSNVALHLTFFSRVHLQCANLMHVSSAMCMLNTEDENENAFDACKSEFSSNSFAASMYDLTFVFALKINARHRGENFERRAAIYHQLVRLSFGGFAMKFERCQVRSLKLNPIESS